MNLSLGLLATFVPAAMLVAATPGANNLLSLIHGAKAGFVPTVCSLLGRMAAFAVLLTLVAVGLGALLERSWLAFVIVKWVGVAYLAYLGVMLWRSRETIKVQAQSGATPLKLARKEFVVAITNPKAILLFTAFVPQFVGPEGATRDLLVLGALYVAIEFVMATGYALAGASVRNARLTPARSRLFNRISGSAMLGASGLLAFTKRTA